MSATLSNESTTKSITTLPSLITVPFGKWLLPLGAIVTLIGYFGPWVNHKVAGLVIMGLDLGEYVKFLLPVRGGEISLWREGFYLPLVTVSLACSLYAFAGSARGGSGDRERVYHYHWIARAIFLAVAIVAALNMLPPAWTPGKLRLPEFQLQTAWILLCLALMAVSPFLGLIPRVIRGGVVTVLALASIWFPVSGFLAVLPTISELYNDALRAGWGMYLLVVGLLVLIVGAWQK